jgi:hypothetical protein
MRKKHFKLSIFLLPVTTILVFGFFMLTTSQAFADNGYKGNDKHKEWQNPKKQEKEYRKHRAEMKRENRKHYEEQRSLAYKKRPDYHNYHGYRELPYDKHRHYGYHDYKGRRYNYQGHWRSWDQWDSYARKHPDIYRHGGYYREGAHLMFRFCDPGTGNGFFFSIGR